MKCLVYFGMNSLKEDTFAHLSGRDELHGGTRVITAVTLKNVCNETAVHFLFESPTLAL